MRWLPSRAHDNGLFLVFSNGVGVDDDEIRTGNAMILDPYGRILAETWKAGRRHGRRRPRRRRSSRRPPAGCGCRRAGPALYGELAVPTGRERDAHELKFEE